MKDKELIRQIQNGNKELLNDIVQKYYDEILRFCIYQIKDAASSYDLTQETFLRFIRCVDTYECRNLKAYLIAIARNLCLDYWHGKLLTEPMEDYRQKEAAWKEPEREFDRVENQMVLVELLSRIPVEQREVLVMRYYSDLKLSDIAKILGVNINTVKSRLRLGLKHLKKEASGFYID